MSVTAALTRKAVGTWGMGTIGASASAPMVVLAGGIVATYATTKVVGVPLGFLLIGAVVALLSHDERLFAAGTLAVTASIVASGITAAPGTKAYSKHAHKQDSAADAQRSQ